MATAACGPPSEECERRFTVASMIWRSLGGSNGLPLQWPARASASLWRTVPHEQVTAAEVR
eukprot:scaffold79504_cov27-Tisochrysis_lutea.AAC.2